MTVSTHNFSMVGQIARLAKGAPGVDGWLPSRPFGGWLTVFALLGADGALTPVVDRDNQIMEAAAELGRIDWSAYLSGGAWNDTHKADVVVGVPTGLEFHDGQSERAQRDGKIGFWTSGHLLDRADPESWERFLPRNRWPTPLALDRADYFWQRASLLDDTPRQLGFSAEGKVALSECKRRMLYAKVSDAAVCELPRNPATTAGILSPSAAMPFHLLAKGMTSDDPCASCSCPPQLRCAVRVEAPPSVPFGVATPQAARVLARIRSTT